MAKKNVKAAGAKAPSVKARGGKAEGVPRVEVVGDAGKLEKAGKEMRESGKARPAKVEAAEEIKIPAIDEKLGRVSVKTNLEKSGVVVVGSLNMDLVVRAETMPKAGETVMGQDLLQYPGGKGANQAAAAGKLWIGKTPGAKLIGRIGDDVFGANMVTALAEYGVETASVLKTKNMPSGTAMIMVDRHGENAIVVAGGANRHLSAGDLLAERRAIESSVVLTAQLEIPHDTVACAFALAKRAGVVTILDPAPAPPEGLPESLYHVDILTPNQLEAETLTGMTVRSVEDARRAAERFLLRGTKVLVFKMGSLGAVIVRKNERGETLAQHVTGFRVPVKDTTAAGDAFTGAMAVGLAEGMELAAAVRFANAVGAMTCMKSGAMASIPGRAEVEAFMAERA